MSQQQVLYRGNGTQKRFEVPGSTNKTVYVGGVLTVPASTDRESVTLTAAPGQGVAVEIDYSETQADLQLDTASKNVSVGMSNTSRATTGSVTYTVNALTNWKIGDTMVVYLPATGTITFAVSGGPTLNGGTANLTRTLVGNPIGIVALVRIQGAAGFAVTGD